MKGYKVFNPDWTCKGFQYEVGKTYEIEDEPILCKRGFHFCEKAIDCFNYYIFDEHKKFAEVEALGEVISDGYKSCTNKITIVREMSWDEVLRIVNTGHGCTGHGNSGNHNSSDFNSGDYNSGWLNSGNRNSGNYNSGWLNSGNRNSGGYNAGSYNSGDNNSGHYNSGDNNSGSFNSGDFNATDGSSGCFNTRVGKIRMFNKESDWTLEDWRSSDVYLILSTMPIGLKWVAADVMTNEEKAKHPEAETTGGYLKYRDNAMRQEWWDSLIDKHKVTIKSMPNFDAEIFEEITGIKI